ncbi:hypothetical protein K501DRAFT_265722 [Backusella circina FSU 941]|nr:hypothetical protein K501DRAFT_265722 [Backusella circina FSU 941]
MDTLPTPTSPKPLLSTPSLRFKTTICQGFSLSFMQHTGKFGFTTGNTLWSNLKIGILYCSDLGIPSSKYCPNAHFLIISNRDHSTIPIYTETSKKTGVFSPKRLYGAVTLDVFRASRFVAEAKDLDPSDAKVAVMGGRYGFQLCN